MVGDVWDACNAGDMLDITRLDATPSEKRRMGGDRVTLTGYILRYQPRQEMAEGGGCLSPR